MSSLTSLLEALQNLLGQLGVPEASRQLGAMIVLYLGVTLLVLLVVVLIWRATRRKPDVTPVDESGGDEFVSEEAAAPEEAEAVTEEAVAAPEESVASPEEGAVALEEVEAAPEDVEVAAKPAAPTGMLHTVRSGLQKTRASLLGRLESLFGGGQAFGPELLEELEEVLITSDFGMETTMALVAALEQRFTGQAPPTDEVFAALREEVASRLKAGRLDLEAASVAPQVIMVVGVNGVGKTTTIGKLASRFGAAGSKVLLGAGDTFRAAAAEQLATWAERAGADIVRHGEGGDPAAVAFDAAQAAVGRKADLLIVDTAGRLHTKTNLMEELKKVRRVLGREIDGAPHQTLLVVDATTGQNALTQARMFQQAVQVDGIVLTKLDGTARGGIVVAINAELGIPVCFVGVGEGVEDLRPFDAAEFVEGLFEKNEGA